MTPVELEYDQFVTELALKPSHYIAGEIIVNSREIIVNSGENAIKQFSEDAESSQRLPGDIINDKDKLRESILRGLPARYRKE